MNKLSLLFCLLFVYVIYGQSKKGYYVTIDGHRVEGSFLETNYLDAATLKFKTDSDKNFKISILVILKNLELAVNLKPKNL